MSAPAPPAWQEMVAYPRLWCFKELTGYAECSVAVFFFPVHHTEKFRRTHAALSEYIYIQSARIEIKIIQQSNNGSGLPDTLNRLRMSSSLFS